jgi:hypothetical protein
VCVTPYLARDARLDGNKGSVEYFALLACVSILKYAASSHNTKKRPYDILYACEASSALLIALVCVNVLKRGQGTRALRGRATRTSVPCGGLGGV